MLEFDYPFAFALLPLPLLVFWLSAEFRDRGEALRAPFFARMVALTGRNPETGAVVLTKTLGQKLLNILIWLFIVTALARPQWAEDPIVRESAARDLLLLIDLSGSMEAEDFTNAAGEKINRLQAVKEVLDEFIDRRKSDRLGLAVFGTSAFPQAPFTEDRDTVKFLLEELQPRMAGPQTMIGDSIGLAIRLFESSDMDNKVVILLTDGNDTGSRMPIARAAEIAADEGIIIHTIAMGDPETVGEEALDIPVLENISTITGGQFFLALDRSELDDIYAELDRLEPAIVETVSYRPKRALFHYPLVGAMALYALLALLMLFRRPQSLTKKNLTQQNLKREAHA
ncbi:MAG: VWA domain-containing protein [Gammaproteobacteria bacterium]